MAKVCAIVPLYNEEERALSTINALKKIKRIDSITAIDDGSVDGTWEVIKSIDGIEVIRHKKNMGKGKSIKDGLEKSPGDIYLLLDGDLCHTAQKLSPLIEEVEKGSCHMCIARMPDSKGGGVGFLKFFSSFGLRLITGIDFPCPLSGQRAVSSQVINDRRIKIYDGFGVEFGMLIGAIKCGYSIKAIELDLEHRVTGKDLRGYIHRIKQFKDVFRVFIAEAMRW